MAQSAQDRSFQGMRKAQRRSSYPADWYFEDSDVSPQTPDHQEDEFLLQSVLLAWKKRTKQDHLLVGCEMPCRWDQQVPRAGVFPDVFVVERPPGDATGYIASLKTWQDGNHPPMLAIEIVSRSRPKKDYKDSPEKHDLLGTFELWIFDPHLFGYTQDQPPVLLQVFQRETNHDLVQKYAGAGPYRSDALDAWVMVKDGDIVIANDPEGNDRWPTLEEAEARRAEAEARRAEAEARRAEAEARRADAAEHRATSERLEKEAALSRIAELEALLAKRK